MIKLSNAETQIEDLKLQLDDALGAEEMLVQLTERNLMLGEVSQVYAFPNCANALFVKKIEEMRITIEDLEALKELNDELEENHMETEKQLHEDLGVLWRCRSSHIPLTVHLCIDRRDLQIREHVHKIEALEETCLDLENTINQFRELVMQLQRCPPFLPRSSHHLKYPFFCLKVISIAYVPKHKPHSLNQTELPLRQLL